MRHSLQIAVLLTILILASCSHQRDIIYRSTSPDGSTAIELGSYSRFPIQPSEIVELQLSSKQGKRIVKSWKAKSLDMFPCFVAAAWNEDSSKVIVLFRNCYSLGEVVAFDTRSYEAIDIAEMEALLAAEIRTRYALRESVLDPIKWASESVEAQHLFVNAKR